MGILQENNLKGNNFNFEQEQASQRKYVNFHPAVSKMSVTAGWKLTYFLCDVCSYSQLNWSITFQIIFMEYSHSIVLK